jgi:hypothetical protein
VVVLVVLVEVVVVLVVVVVVVVQLLETDTVRVDGSEVQLAAIAFPATSENVPPVLGSNELER